MKYRITCNLYHARSVRPNVSECIFTFRKVKLSFSPTCIDFAKWLLCRTGAERHAIAVVGVVTAAVAVVVDITKVRG